MSTHTPPITLNFDAAEEELGRINRLDEADMDAIFACSSSLVDYLYWYNKAGLFAQAQATGLEEEAYLIQALSEAAEDDRLLFGSSLAALVEPFVGRGVHRAQLQLLSAGADSLAFGAAA